MQNFNWGGIFQLLIYFLILGAPALGWIVKKLREQAALKAERERRRQVERDALRTTQVVERSAGEDSAAENGPGDDRQRAMRELAAQRQAQLQELRQRQLEAARLRQQQGQAQPQVRATPMAPQPGVGSSLVGAPAPRPAPVPTPVRAPAQTPTQRRRRPDQQVPRPAPAARRGVEPRIPVVAPTGRKGKRVGVRSMLFDDAGRARSRNELRGLIALTEVLGKPVSMRKGFGLEGER